MSYLAPFFDGLRQVFLASLRPGTFFAERSPSFTAALRGPGNFFLLTVVLVTITSLVQELRQPESLMSPVFREHFETFFPRERTFPTDVIFFVLGWLLFAALASATRHMFVLVLGEKERALSVIFYITAFAAAPVLACATLLRIAGNLVPYVLFSHNLLAGQIRLAVSAILFLGAAVWEGIICVKGLKQHISGNRGRAILTWFSPYVIIILSFTILTFWLSGGQ